ncbi:MAG TPA: MgtC/SapB family protein [Acidobacteriaceae bacterium]|nr:MgtC/SapB family protein [Acidobacteriaceae bacterium]
MGGSERQAVRSRVFAISSACRRCRRIAPADGLSPRALSRADIFERDVPPGRRPPESRGYPPGISWKYRRYLHPLASLLTPTKCMTPEIHWTGIALRLLLTVVAGGLLGIERSRTGHAAGLRTTLLVTLAASVAMIQMNLLIPTNGKPPNSYAVMDLMRLPLGILTGVGFIGAGAIVRKDEMVVGLTTAATMWFATVVGLCLGGGQIILGSVSTILGMLVLAALRPFENTIETYQKGELEITIPEGQLSAEELRARLEAAAFRIRAITSVSLPTENRRKIKCEVRWPSSRQGPVLPSVVVQLEKIPGLIELEWKGFDPRPN